MMNIQHIQSLLASMRKAIAAKDHQHILSLCEMLVGINWDAQPDWLFDDYDDLIDQANEIEIN